VYRDKYYKELENQLIAPHSANNVRLNTHWVQPWFPQKVLVQLIFVMEDLYDRSEH
jgi:hypothetical protein